MKGLRYILFLVMASLVGGFLPNQAYAAETDLGPAAKFFANMPLSVLELINKNRRLDMLDYYAADSIYRAPNGMEGFSYLETVSPDYLKLSLTPVSELTVSVFPVGNDTIYQCIYTLGSDTQAHDSEIKFYDGNYNQLPTKKLLPLPELSDFYDIPTKNKKEIIAKIEGIIPFPTITYTFRPETSELSAKLTSGEMIGAYEYNTISKYIKPELIYKWNGKKYQLQKSSK